MNKSLIFKIKIVLLLIFSGLFSVFSSTDKNNIIVLPFDNHATPKLEYISKLIQNSLTVYLKITPNYNAIKPEIIKEYLKNNQFNKGDLQNINKLIQIAKEFNAVSVIRGKFYEKDGLLIIDFEVIDTESKKIIYRCSKFGKGSINTFDTVENIASSMVEDFTGINLIYGTLEVITDYDCKVFINDEFVGICSKKFNLPTGKHILKVLYESEQISGNIYENIINIEKEEKESLKFRVFTNFKVSSELPCELYINDKFVGDTPYETQLLSNNEYNLKLLYNKNEKNKEIVVLNKIFTKMNDDIELYFPVTGKIIVKSGNNPFKGGIVGINFGNLPLEYNDLSLGKYRVKVFLDDIIWKRRLTFFNKMLFLKPQENKVIDLSKIKYKKLYGLCFIPSASQFYNRQPIKGAIALSGFLSFITVSILSPVFSYLYYTYDLLPKINLWKKYKESGDLSMDDIKISYKNVSYIFWGTLISGLASAFSFYMFSLIDGFININHIYKLFNPSKQISRIKIIPVIEVKIINN